MLTPAISLLKRPLACAAFAFCWLASAAVLVVAGNRVLLSSRFSGGLAHRIHAVLSFISGLMKRQPKLLSNISASRPYGVLFANDPWDRGQQRSMPSAMNTSPLFAAIARPAPTTALMPEAAQTIDYVSTGNGHGQTPASSNAMRNNVADCLRQPD